MFPGKFRAVGRQNGNARTRLISSRPASCFDPFFKNSRCFSLQFSSPEITHLQSCHLVRAYATAFTVASSSIQLWTDNLASRLESLATNLLLSVQSLIRNVTAGTLLKSAAQPENSTPTIEKLYSLFIASSTVSYPTVCATLLAAVFFCYRYSMSYYTRGSSIDGGWGGRTSPFTATSGRGSIADHVEYLTNDSLLSEPRHSYTAHRASVGPTHSYVDEEAPDTLLLRYKHRTYELHFKPYAISDGLLLVSDVRKYAAEKLNTDPRRLRLLYKGRPLRDDTLEAKAYKLKQNSEIMCVISEVEALNGAGSDHSGSGDDSSSVASNTNKPRRSRAESTTRPRSQYETPPQQSQPSYQSSAHQHRNPSTGRVNTRPSSENLRATAMERQSSKQSSTGHLSPPRARSPMPPPSRGSPPQPRPSTMATNTPIDPNSPLGKVNALSSTFHTQWLTKCTQFIMNPPSDLKTRDLEYAKLSEGVMAQIVLKADNLEMEGDAEARASRKQLVNEATEVLKKLDAVGKRHS